MRLFSLFFVLVAFSCSEPIKESNVETEQVSTVLTDSVFTGGIEGPAFNSNGDLFVVNFKAEGNIGVLPNGKDSFELFLSLPKGSIGNGIRFNTSGDMFIADYVNHNILIIEKGTKHVEIYAHNKLVNQPNDLTLHSNGFGFASDPNWAKGTGNILRFSEGIMEIVEDSMGTTNGIELSPDGTCLYVNESVQRKIWKYDVSEKGDLANKTLFTQFDDFGMDGMRCNSKGNLFVARYGVGVIVELSPEGKIVNEFKLNGKKPTNVTFKQNSDKEIYITMQEKKWVELIKLP